MYNMCVITSLISVLLICVGINANTTKHNVQIDTDLSTEEVSGSETDHNGQDNKLFITTLNTILGNHENSTNDTFIVAKSTPYTLHVYKSINTTELTSTPPKSLNDIDDDIMTRKVTPPKFLTKKIQRTTLKPVAKFEAVKNDVHQHSTKSKKFMKVTTTPKNIAKKTKIKEQTGKSKKVFRNLKDVKFETNLTSCTLQKNGRNKIRSAIDTNSTLNKPLCARPKNVNQNVKPKPKKPRNTNENLAKKPRNTNENLAKKPKNTNKNLANRKPKQTTKPTSRTANNAKNSGQKNKTKRSENARSKTKRPFRKIKNNRSKLPPRPKPDNKNKKTAKTDKKSKKTKQNKEQKTKGDNSKKNKQVVKPTSSPSPPTLRSSPTSPSPPSSTSPLSPPSPTDKEPWLYTGKISDLVKRVFFN